LQNENAIADLAYPSFLSYAAGMKTLTIRLPDSLAAEIEHESQARHVSKSDVVRERLRQPHSASRKRGTMAEMIGNLIGSVSGLPADLSSNKKKYLPELIRAKKLHR
jgi:Arc/MetJ-type ribon-helix-helix transcriptional regulator